MKWQTEDKGRQTEQTTTTREFSRGPRFVYDWSTDRDDAADPDGDTTFMKRSLALIAFILSSLAITGCGGGGGGSTPTSGGGGGGFVPTPMPTSTAAATATPTAVTVAGTVVQAPVDSYGPVTMGSQTYAAADATQTTPLSGATVIVGPVPVNGATPPATLPTGDVSTTTSSGGAFSVTLGVAPAAPSADPFVIPTNNILAITPPATGYYVEVFGVGTDGKSANVPIPLHRFFAVSSSLALRVSSTSTAEAGALTALNNDRLANGAGPLTFDEMAEEAARLHASDESSGSVYLCHYDIHNVGPSSRYLAVGGIGLTGESLGGGGSLTDLAADFQTAETAFMSEKTQTPPGGHYTNNVDVAHLWAGLAVVPYSATSMYVGASVDYELVTPSAQDSIVGSSGYIVSPGCPSGTTNNNS